MTSDLVVLARREPSTAALVRALLAADPELRVGSIGAGVALQLFDQARTLVATVELPTQVRVRGEAQRLLGIDGPEPPYWWIEIRCPTLRPDSTAVGLRLAAALVDQLDGVMWQTPSLL